jgi:Prealbumin-like fold domain
VTQRLIGPSGSRRRRRFLLTATFLVLAAMVVAIGASAGPVGTAAGFEDDDGNLAPQAPINFDWNSFSPTTWTGTPPYRESDKVVSGWTFKGIEDDAATNSDTGFAGGTKQDDDCATVGGSKAPNKDDLKRIYLATKVVGGNTFLELAWVRIPQNTTSASAHVAFEFNKGSTPCGGSSDGLVQRTAGDMLIVYDFEGGTTDVPTLTLRRWVLTGACEVGNRTAPCWGPATNLTAGGFAEAKVNTFGSVQDLIGPISPETLGTSEFGEAGINLTAAGVFPAGSCESFGQALGISRSSGNSGTAQMKDLVGPADFSISNCGTITIIKHTSPGGIDQNFDFTSNIAGTQLSCLADTSPASFTLNDAGTDTETCTNVPIGSYIVTEGDDPAGFDFNDVTCVATGSGTGAQDALIEKQANISIVAGGDTVTCTYVNDQVLGAIKISKTSSKTGNPLAGATFSITGPNSYSNSVQSGPDGTVCVGGLAFGAYTVTETAAPTGFVIDDPLGHPVTVDNNASCSDDPFGGETTSFTDTPTADIQVNFRDGGSGETSVVGTITCDNTTGSGDDTAASGWDASHTVTGIHAPATVTCTIVIDP